MALDTRPRKQRRSASVVDLGEIQGQSRRVEDSGCRRSRSGGVAVLPIVDDDMAAVHELMARYADRPMDFTDATLVRLAEREGLSTIFTIDHAGFGAYRIGGRGPLRVATAP
jgi:predicted nucleic acid-binding protein